MPIKHTVLQMSRFRVWLFLYATRIVEFVNGCFIVGFSLVFIYDTVCGGNRIFEMGNFTDFKNANILMWLGFFALGIAQFAAMLFYSIRSNKASGLILVLSSAIWAVVAATFITSRSGVITTGPVIYGIWATMSLLAGYELLSVNKKIEAAVNEGA